MSFWAWMLSWKKSPVRIRMPIAIRIAPATGHDRRVVALDRLERGRHPRERERGDQEGDPEARRVDGEQERAVRGRARTAPRRSGSRPAWGRCRASRRSRTPSRRSAGPPLPARAISASTCHSRFRRATNRLATNRTPIAMITRPGDLLEGVAVVLERLAEPGGGQPEEDEDGREAGHEDQARDRGRGASSARSSSPTETPVTADR